ncbi:uncharacterized homolog isoform X1 [Nerophis lumbriciformis]|uniref:uncharacterized homolog isoform X1 n=1 Tax=Nerophis lumbriciformis TaxID=546530 RepID=UPI003BAC6A8C
MLEAESIPRSMMRVRYCSNIDPSSFKEITCIGQMLTASCCQGCVCVCVFLVFSFLNMPAVMYLTVLISMVAVTISQDTTSSSTTKQRTAITLTSLSTKTNEGWSGGGTQQRAVTSAQESPWPSPTNKGTQDTETPFARLTSDKTTPLLSTFSAALTDNTPHHDTSSQAPPLVFDNNNLGANPGLVAIVSVFGIILTLVLIVAMVKCIQSPRYDFERIEDVPMGWMNQKQGGYPAPWPASFPCLSYGQQTLTLQGQTE